MLNSRASAEGSLKFIDEAALDPYVFTRESFLQWRNNLATDGKFQASTDFDDELLENDQGSTSPTTDKKASAPSSKSLEKTEQVSEPQKPGYSLHLDTDKKEFGPASKSFGTATQSFDQTTKSFEKASSKVELLKKND